MRCILITTLILLSSSVFAGDKDTIIKKLMEAQGLLQTFEQQLDLGRQQSREQGRSMLNQMMSRLNPTPEFHKRFEEAFKSFMSEVETPWGAEEIVDVWAKYYGDKFTAEELNNLLSFYSSPLAQKEVIASREALVSFSNHFSEAGKPIAKKAISNFITNLRLVAKQCNCKKSANKALNSTPKSGAN